MEIHGLPNFSIITVMLGLFKDGFIYRTKRLAINIIITVITLYCTGKSIDNYDN